LPPQLSQDNAETDAAWVIFPGTDHAGSEGARCWVCAPGSSLTRRLHHFRRTGGL